MSIFIQNVIPQPASVEMSSFDSASSLAHGDNVSNKKSISHSSQSHPLSRSEDDIIPLPPPMGMAYTYTIFYNFNIHIVPIDL